MMLGRTPSPRRRRAADSGPQASERASEREDADACADAVTLEASARRVLEGAFLVAGTSALASGVALGVASSIASDPRRARSALRLVAGIGAGYLRDKLRAACGAGALPPADAVDDRMRSAIMMQYARAAVSGALSGVAREHFRTPSAPTVPFAAGRHTAVCHDFCAIPE